MIKTALIIVFNHRYDDNIKFLRKHYSDKFPIIRFLVPFYDGTDPDVIPVFHNSRFFQGYFATSCSELIKLSVDRYLIIADDMIINPIICEDNLSKNLNVNKDENFITNIWTLHSNQKWSNYKSILNFTITQQGIEVNNILPKISDALSLLSKFNAKMEWVDEESGEKIKINYPLICGYSDLLLVSSKDFLIFSKYCGVMAALGLFVEVAIPTALALISPSKLMTHESSKSSLNPYAIWNKDELDSFSNSYERSFIKLIDKFPMDKLFIHPVKLSNWSWYQWFVYCFHA